MQLLLEMNTHTLYCSVGGWVFRQAPAQFEQSDSRTKSVRFERERLTLYFLGPNSMTSPSFQKQPEVR